MKKIISTIMLLAAAATAFTSCDKQNAEATQSPEESVLVFTSEKPSFDDDVKTEWIEIEKTVYWSEHDKIRVAYTVDGVWQKADGNVTSDDEAMLYASTEAQSSNGFLTANFSVPSNFGNPISGNHKFYGLYPSNKVNSNNSKFTAPVVKINVNSAQSLSSDTFDASADLMLGTSEEIQDRPTGAIPLRWNRLVAHAYITLADLKDFEAGEVVSSVTLTADSDAAMTGDFDLNITTGVSSLNKNNTTANVLTVNNGSLTVVEGDVVFWACMMPCTWNSLTVVVDTDKATYTREIDLTGKEKTFLQNRRNLLTINMATANREEKEPVTSYFTHINSLASHSDLKEYILVYENDGTRKVATEFAGSQLNAEDIVYTDGKGYAVTAKTEGYTFRLLQVPEATSYYILMDGNYVGYDTSTSLVSSSELPSENQDKYQWNITFDNDNVVIQNVNTTTRYLKYYASGYFKAYTSTNGNKNIKLYVHP